MTVLPRLIRRSVATAATAVVAVLAVSGISAPVLAHGGDGAIEVVTTIRAGDDVQITVRLTFVDDGHGIPDATVTAVVEGQTPVPLEADDQEGLYSGAVPAQPGDVIRISSVEPPTSIEIEAPALEDEFPPLPSGPEVTATTTTAPDATTTTGDDEEADDEDAAPATVTEDDDGDDDGSSALPIVIGGVVVVGLVAGLGFALTRKGGDDEDDAPTA